MSAAGGLALAFVSALAVNWGYVREHDAAEKLPRLSPRRPLRSARLLVRDRAWLRGFGLETGGWLLFVAALRLAPLALVQAVGAAGIAVLALVSVQGHLLRLPRHEIVAVAVGLAGLALIAASLLGPSPTERRPSLVLAVVWLAACAGGSFVLLGVRLRISRAATLGLSAGLLFAAGDVSVKLLVRGGWWLFVLPVLLGFYAVGSVRLQVAFQRGDALSAAGMATLATNAIPMAAGFVVFREALPGGIGTPMQIAGFAATVVSAIALGEHAPQRRGADERT